MIKPPTYAVIYQWPPGTKPTVHYRRSRTDTRLAREVLTVQRRARKHGFASPYRISTAPEFTL